MFTRRWALRIIPLLFCTSLYAQRSYQKDIAHTSNTLLIEGHVLNIQEEPLERASVRVRSNHKDLAIWDCDKNGQFAITLDIGDLYAIDVMHTGYLKKRFIVDARAEDPKRVRPKPFEAFVTLLPLEAVKGANLDDLDFPFALLTYSPKAKAFLADPDYVEQMKKLEFEVLEGSAINQGE